MNAHDTPADEPFPIDLEMAELSLLLPRSQALALIEAAKRQGITVAQFLRKLVSRALVELGTVRSEVC